MHELEKYINTKTVIKCENAEEWDFLCRIFNVYDWKFDVERTNLFNLSKMYSRGYNLIHPLGREHVQLGYTVLTTSHYINKTIKYKDLVEGEYYYGSFSNNTKRCIFIHKSYGISSINKFTSSESWCSDETCNIRKATEEEKYHLDLCIRLGEYVEMPDIIFKENEAYHAESEEEANKLLKEAHDQGYKWYNGDSYLKYNYYEKDKTYNIVIGGHSGLKYYKEKTNNKIVTVKQLFNLKTNKQNGKTTTKQNSETIKPVSRRNRSEEIISQLGRRGDGVKTINRGRRNEIIQVGTSNRRRGEGICITRKRRQLIEVYSR